MTAAGVFELTTQGGATDFARLIEICESFGPYCLIGGLAANCYVEPVYTLDADIVMISANLPKMPAIWLSRSIGDKEGASKWMTDLLPCLAK